MAGHRPRSASASAMCSILLLTLLPLLALLAPAMAVAEAKPLRAAVFALKNLTGSSSLDWVSIGLQDSLTNDMWYVSAVDTEALPALTAQLNGQCSGMELECLAHLDFAAIRKIAQERQYDWIIWGEYRHEGHNSILVELTIYVADGFKKAGTVKFNKPLQELPGESSLQLLALLKKKGIVVKSGERDRIVSRKTISEKAWESNAKGFWLQQKYAVTPEENRPEIHAQWIKLLEDAVTIDPTYAEAWNNLGWAKADSGESSFGAALKLKPFLIDANLGMGWHARKEEYLVKGVEANPSLANHLRILSSFYLDMHNPVPSMEALPHLISTLKSRDASLYPLARMALSRVPRNKSDAIPLLAALLDDANRDTRASAANVLGLIGCADAVPRLARALKDPDGLVRLNAAEALGRTGSPEAVPHLIEMLKRTDRKDLQTWEIVRQALADSASHEAIPYLAEALKEGKEIAREASGLLAVLGGKDVMPPLVEECGSRLRACMYELPDGLSGGSSIQGPDPKEFACIQGCPALENAVWPETAKSIAEMLADENRWVRLAAAFILMKNRFTRDVPEFVKALGGEWDGGFASANDIDKVVWSLGSMELPGGQDPLLHALDDTSEAVRRSAVEVLGRMRALEAVPKLCQVLLEDPSVEVRQAVAVVLGKIGSSDEALPCLVKALKEDNDETVRGMAADALGDIGRPEGVAHLIQALEEDFEAMRGYAAKSLARMGTREAFEYLIHALKDPDEVRRKDAGYALHDITPRIIPMIVEDLRSEPEGDKCTMIKALGSVLKRFEISVKKKDNEFRATVAEAVEMLSKSGAPELLVAYLESGSSDLRRCASNGLLAMGKAESHDVVERLSLMLENEDPGKRRDAAHILKQICARDIHGDHSDLCSCFFGVLQKESDEAVLHSMAQYLPGVRSAEAVPQLIQALGHPNKDIKTEACHALREIGSPDAVPALVRLLTDRGEETAVRAAAARALGKIADPKSIPHLLDVLRELEQKHRDTSDAGSDAEQVVDGESFDSRSGMRTDDTEPVEGSFTLLDGEPEESDASDEGAVAEEIVYEGSPEDSEGDGDELWESVARALTGIAGVEAMPYLTRVLRGENGRHADEDTQIKAVRSLGRIGNQESIDLLRELLRDKRRSLDIRIEAARALCELGHEESIPDVVGILAGILAERSSARYKAGESIRDALVRMGSPETLSYLAELLLNSEKLAERVTAASLLGEIGSPDTVPYLLKSIAIDQEFSVRAEAIRAFRGKLLPFFPLLLLRHLAQVLMPAFDSSPVYSPNLLALAHFCSLSSVHRSRMPTQAHGLSMIGRIVNRENYSNSLTGKEDILKDITALQGAFPGEKIKDNPYVLFLASHILKQNRLFQDALDLSSEALKTAAEAHDIPLLIELRCLRAESFMGVDLPGKAIKELEIVEKTLLGKVSGFDLYRTDRQFASYTLTLKGKALAQMGKPHESVMSLEEARKMMWREWKVTKKAEERLEMVLHGIYASSGHEAAKISAQKSTDLAKSLPPRNPLEEDAVEAACLKRIEMATSSDDLEDAHKLMEELALKKQGQAARSGLQTASEKKKAVCSRISTMRSEIDELRGKAEALEQKAPPKEGSADHGASGGKESKELVQQLKQQIKQKELELRDYFVSLEKTHPEVTTLMGAMPVDVKVLRGSLSPDQAIVQYLLLRDKTLIFLFAQNAMEKHEAPIGKDELERKIEAYRKAIQDVTGSSTGRLEGTDRTTQEHLAKLGAELAAILIDPVLPELEAYKHLIVVPNGKLHFLPFGALPTGGRYLAEDFVVTYLPSSSLLSVVVGKRSSDKKLCAMAVSSECVPGRGPLDEAEAEVEAVGAHFPEDRRRILVGREAARSALIGQDLAGYHLHLSTCGYVGSIAKTRLALSDGDLTVRDVWGLCLDDSPLVTLSACETNVADLMSRDEIASLANGFIYAGARCVVSSLWKVPEGPTRKLMEMFYSEYDKTGNKPEAMAYAQRQMIQEDYSPWSWAGFVMNGW